MIMQKYTFFFYSLPHLTAFYRFLPHFTDFYRILPIVPGFESLRLSPAPARPLLKGVPRSGGVCPKLKVENLNSLIR